MRYLMLVRVDESLEAKMTDAERASLPEATTAWVKEMDGRGARVMGQRLRPVQESKVVRHRRGQLSVTDGPFAESKEQIAGFDILECASLEEAVEVASKHPVARFGALEVRAFWPM